MKYISDENGYWVPADEYRPKKQAGLTVIPDIQPYQSMLTGEIITSRSKHRVHLRDHGYIEVGNERQEKKPLKSPPGLKQTIIEQVNKLR